MPVYCYRPEGSDETVEVIMTVIEMLNTQAGDGSIQLPDGRIAYRDFRAEVSGARLDTVAGTCSESLAVHPSQVAEATENCRIAGVPTEYKKTGEPVWRSSAHRKRFLKRFGYVDKSAYC